MRIRIQLSKINFDLDHKAQLSLLRRVTNLSMFFSFILNLFTVYKLLGTGMILSYAKKAKHCVININ